MHNNCMSDEAIHIHLFRAGWYSPGIVRAFRAVLGLAPLTGALILGALFAVADHEHQLGATSLIVGALFGLALGNFLPRAWLHQMIEIRQREANHCLPVVLSQVEMGLEGGLNLPEAVYEVVQVGVTRGQLNPVTQLLTLALLLNDAGLPFDEALTEISTTANLPHLSTLTAAAHRADRALSA